MAGRCAWGLTGAAALATLVGCGSSTSSKVGNSYSTARPAVVTTPRSLGAKKTVSIVSSGGRYAYEPRTLTITAGTIVAWKNTSGVPHTVTFIGRSLPSREVKSAGTVAATFTRGGTFAYHCTIHPYMKGAIIVNAR